VCSYKEEEELACPLCCPSFVKNHCPAYQAGRTWLGSVLLVLTYPLRPVGLPVSIVWQVWGVLVDPGSPTCPRCQGGVPLRVVRYGNGQLNYCCPVCAMGVWKYEMGGGRVVDWGLPVYVFRGVLFESRSAWNQAVLQWKDVRRGVQ
jgi:hypothetical protein